MKVAVVLFSLMALAAAAPGYLAAPGYVAAPALVRTPQYDSAVIQSSRLGGNFAYSTVEAQAYAAVSPVVSRVVSPVAVSYHATPVVAPAPVVAAPLVAPAPVVAAHGHYVL